MDRTGILVYGIAYFFVHEVFIHQRIEWLRNANTAYFLGLRRAHKVHHKRLEKEEGVFRYVVGAHEDFREAKRKSLQMQPQQQSASS